VRQLFPCLMALLYAVIASFEGTTRTKYLSWAC
jgi:hypothetical protein